DGGRDSRLPAAGAVQGQGREVFGREDFAERSEEEVRPMKLDKRDTRLRRALRSRVKIKELAALRLSVHRTPKHIYAQIFAPEGDTVLVAASTLQKEVRGGLKTTGNIKVAFDRSGFMYHGRVKALAEAAREGGLEF